VQVAAGHAISATDAAGIVPLAFGSTWLHYGLWRRRHSLDAWVRRGPGRAVAVFSLGAFGLGLLVASAFSAFFWWWAIGAVLFAAMHIPLLRAAVR